MAAKTASRQAYYDPSELVLMICEGCVAKHNKFRFSQLVVLERSTYLITNCRAKTHLAGMC